MNRPHLVPETATHCELVSLNTGRSVANIDELENNQSLAKPTPRVARQFSTWNPPSHAEWAYPQNCMVEQPRNQVSEMHFDNFPTPYVPVLVSPRKQCTGSKKWRWSNRWTVLSHLNKFEGIVSLTLRCLMRRLLPPWKNHPELLLQEKRRSGRAKGPNGWPISSWESDCGHDPQALTRLFLIVLIYFAFLNMETILKTLIRDGTKFCCRSNRNPQTIAWVVCIRFAHVGLIKSKPYWQCTNKKVSHISHSRTIRSCRRW